MNAQDDGGPAFPVLVRCYDLDTDTYRYSMEGGLSARDYFAAKAMQTLIGLQNMNSFALDADAAYEMADAMLQRRLT